MPSSVLRGLGAMKGWLVAPDGRWRGPARLWSLLRGRLWLVRGWSAARDPEPDLPVAERALRRAVQRLIHAGAEPAVAQALLVQVLVERGFAPRDAVREAARDPGDALELEALWLIPAATALRDRGPHRALPVLRQMLTEPDLAPLPPARRAAHRVIAAHVAARRRSADEAEAWITEALQEVDDPVELGPTGLIALALARERLDDPPDPRPVRWLEQAVERAEADGLVVSADARRGLARALARRGRLTDAAHVGAGLPELAAERAGWLVSVGDDAGALAALDGRLHDRQAVVWAARALRRLGRPDEALEVLESVDDLTPTPSSPRSGTPLSILLEGPSTVLTGDLDVDMAEERARALLASGRRDEALSSLGVALHRARGLALHGEDQGALERLEALGFELVGR